MSNLKEMINAAPDYNVKDFLSAIGFIVPVGYKLDSFILPSNSTTDFSGSDYIEVESNLDSRPGITDTIQYKRKPRETLKSEGSFPIEYSQVSINTSANNVANSQPVSPPSAPIGKMGSPFIDEGKNLWINNLMKNNQHIAEKTQIGKNRIDVLLKETICFFPKNTMMTFKLRNN